MIHFKKYNQRCRNLAFLFAGILTFIIAAILSPAIASAQTRIISLSGDLDFGRVPFNSSAQRTLTIYNTGDSPLTVTNFAFGVPAIEVVDFGGGWSGQIAPGGSQDAIITFTPSEGAEEGTNDVPYTGSVMVLSDATSGVSDALISGIDTWPPASSVLSPVRNLDFGDVPIGGLGEVELTLTNLGTLPVTITNITLPDGFSSFFGFGSSASVTIAAGAITNVFILFSPTNVDTYGGIATIQSDATEGSGTNFAGLDSFTVSGTGVYPSGKFIGLFAPTNDATFENSGYFAGNCDAKGKFRGTLTLAGKRYPFSAQVSPSGAMSATIVRRKLGNLNVSLLHDIYGTGRSWSGTIDSDSWSAALRIEQVILLKRNSLRLVPSGAYPMNIAGCTNAIVGPTEPGSSSITVKISDATRLTGTLGDGTRFSQNTILCGEDVPMYVPLYHNRGAITGWVSIRRDFLSLPPIIVIRPPSTNPPIIVINPLTNAPVIGPPFTNPPIIIRLPSNPPGIILPITNSPIVFPHQSAELSVTVTNEVVGTINWFKPAGIDRDYPDGFSFQTTVSGSVP